MEMHKKIDVSLDEAKEWFNSENATLKEIAQHLGKYFGMLITEAKYGDLPDFQITERIY